MGNNSLQFLKNAINYFVVKVLKTIDWCSKVQGRVIKMLLSSLLSEGNKSKVET